MQFVEGLRVTYLVGKLNRSVPVCKTRREGYGRVRRSEAARVSLRIDSGCRVEIRSDICVTFNLKLGSFYDISEVCSHEGRGVNTLRA